jgi:hypothetical protein
MHQEPAPLTLWESHNYITGNQNRINGRLSYVLYYSCAQLNSLTCIIVPEYYILLKISAARRRSRHTHNNIGCGKTERLVPFFFIISRAHTSGAASATRAWCERARLNTKCLSSSLSLVRFPPTHGRIPPTSALVCFACFGCAPPPFHPLCSLSLLRVSQPVCNRGNIRPLRICSCCLINVCFARNESKLGFFYRGKIHFHPSLIWL